MAANQSASPPRHHRPTGVCTYIAYLSRRAKSSRTSPSLFTNSPDKDGYYDAEFEHEFDAEDTALPLDWVIVISGETR